MKGSGKTDYTIITGGRDYEFDEIYPEVHAGSRTM